VHDAWLPVTAIASLASGPFMFLRGFRTLRIRQLIQNTPTARIRSMAMGLVEVYGSVSPRSQVVAPFSGRPCAYWELDVSVRGRRRGSWSVVHRDASGHPLYLRDTTGVALLYPHGATCKINFGVEEECSGLMLPELYSQYLSQQHVGMGLWRLGQLRFRERVLEEGQRVYVLGTATPRANALTISDGEAMRATGTDGAAGPAHDPMAEVKAVIRRGEHEPTFIISQESERSLTFDLGWEATGKLVGGPALTLFGLGYWLLAASGHR
jgi:hypothetical protein